MTTESDHDRLDTLLDASAPEVPEPALAVRTEAVSMIAAAEHGDDRQHSPRRRLSRAAVIGITASSLLGVGGLSTAAATYEQWSWWAQDPDAAISFMLPSGAACEIRITSAIGRMDPDAAQAARDWASSVDLETVVDVDGTIERMRADEYSEVLEDGTTIVGGYGTDVYYTPDMEYYMAVNQALGDVLGDELVRQGFDGYVDYSGETICPGYEW